MGNALPKAPYPHRQQTVQVTLPVSCRPPNELTGEDGITNNMEMVLLPVWVPTNENRQRRRVDRHYICTDALGSSIEEDRHNVIEQRLARLEEATRAPLPNNSNNNEASKNDATTDRATTDGGGDTQC